MESRTQWVAYGRQTGAVIPDHGEEAGCPQRRRPARILVYLVLLCGAFPLIPGPQLLLAGVDPEEPDFFFLTGGPYTQGKGSPQLIWANRWFTKDHPGGREQEYAGAGRFELGITDRWEAGFEFGLLHHSETLASTTLLSETGTADVLFGVRYRLLDESFAPLTLTLGPRVSIPLASRRRGFGYGKAGYACDVAAAKDWGGSLFAVASLNAAWFPGVSSTVGSPGPAFDLTEVVWGMALGLRALELARQDGRHHDLHALFEFGGSRADEVEGGLRGNTTQTLFAPGLRYGFTGSGGALAEIGVSVPLGLNRDSPDWGIIVQVQFEVPGKN